MRTYTEGRKMKYRAICGNTSRIIHGCVTPEDALCLAIDIYDDCLDHTEDIQIYDIAGNYLLGEEA